MFREQKTLIAAAAYLLYEMNDIFINEDPFPCGNNFFRVKCFHTDAPFQYIDELQVFVPVHHAETRV